MSEPVQIITLSGVNCYLLAAEQGYVLIDTATPGKRSRLGEMLYAAGCGAGELRLIVLTHGDYDHAGNAAFLRKKSGVPIAMSRGDAIRVETADWHANMKPRPDKFSPLMRVVSAFIRPGRFDTFAPDVYLEDRQDLAGFGLDAIVLDLPGHTSGSIGILTAAGDLFCGDLMDSTMGRPSLQFFIDDMQAAQTSLARLRTLDIRKVYPGHGKPFRLEQVK